MLRVGKRWHSAAAAGLLLTMAAVGVVLHVMRQGARQQRVDRGVLLQLHRVRPPTPPPNPLKNIVIDRVYFPEGREDAGLAKVHGVVNGKYVEGTLRIQRTASYNPKEGAWTGVSQQPLIAEKHRYNKAVEHVVASSIATAMKDMLRTNGTSAALAPNLPESYLDPEQSIAQEVYRKAGQAIASVFEQEESNPGNGQQLRAKRSPPVHERLLKKLLARKQAQAREAGSLRSLPLRARTIGGCNCQASFAYKGATHSHCIRTDSERGWCFTEGKCGRPSNEAPQELWDFCEEPLTRTLKGCECEFPFWFEGEQHRTCIDASRSFLYGKEAAPGQGPRGTWCQTRGHCGVGQLQSSEGVRAFWDRCDLPGLAATSAATPSSLAMAAGSTGHGGMCGATVGDMAEHRRAFEFSRECGRGLVCAWSCASGSFCPSCAGGNCRCTAQKKAGEACGNGSNRPPAYSHYECESGRCLFACTGAACSDCNHGNCKCAAA